VLKTTRYLYISVLFASLNVSVFGELYVNGPDSYFGPANQFTQIGIGFALGSLLLTALSSWGFHRDRPWARSLAVTTVTGSFAAFLPMLLHDPTRALPVLGWQCYALIRLWVEPRPQPGQMQVTAADVDYHSAHRNASVFAILITIAIDGFRLTEHFFGLALCGIAHLAALVFFVPTLLRTRREAPRLFFALITVLILSVVMGASPGWGLGMAAFFQVASLYASARRHPMLLGALEFFLRIPALFITLSFFIVIALGAMFLTFPASTVTGTISPVDALFTAVSAVCVTGLIVLDTPADFTLFGQGVILVLIQLGGLGIMTLSTAGARIVAGNLGLLAESTFGALLDVRGARSVYKLMRVIIFSTILIEAVGALCLTLIFRGYGLAWGEAFWKGIFHSVSAFCNAGFALQSNSLEGFAGDYGLLTVIMVLIVAGGIGFPTMVMVLDHFRTKHRTRLPVQVRIILWTTGALILAGWLGFAALEWNGVLAPLDPAGKMMNALFQSVTLRTAGFNSVSMSGLRDASLAFMILFMFVGGAPGSTAGGIKVTTLSVLLAAVPTFGYGEGTVTIGGRHISTSTMYRAISVVVVTLVTVLFIHFGLLLAGRHAFRAVAFEAVSAVGTVGLSTGITASLSTAGKILLMVGMFAGRLGPLTLTLAVAGRQQKRYKLATEPVMVG
jgi:trk system potassium uptake protein TrkH